MITLAVDGAVDGDGDGDEFDIDFILLCCIFVAELFEFKGRSFMEKQFSILARMSETWLITTNLK